MKSASFVPILKGVLVLIAVLFGGVTLVVGTRVLLGADPGFVVYRPLLIYNTIMGLAYIAAGLLAWRHVAKGRQAAGAIFVLNAVVLGIIGYLYQSGGAVAMESVRAMTLRTVVWLLLLVGWAWLARKPRAARSKL